MREAVSHLLPPTLLGRHIRNVESSDHFWIESRVILKPHKGNTPKLYQNGKRMKMFTLSKLYMKRVNA